MRLTRVYLDSEIHTEQLLLLPVEQSHHLARVLRMRVGQDIHLFNGKGGYYISEINSIQKQGVSVIPRAYIQADRESSLRITLAQGISRGRHMDYTIQKAVELGVHRLVPLITEHSNFQSSDSKLDNKIDHWQKIIISACEQCGRNTLTEISSPMKLDDLLKAEPEVFKIFLEPYSGQSLSSVTTNPENLVIISGPEGGFSSEELEKAHRQGCIPVKLGPRVLRTETAAVAAISACQMLWGDFR